MTIQFKPWLCLLAAAALLYCTASSATDTALPSLYERIEAKLAADPAFAAKLGKPAEELASVRWLVGTWDVTATVFATKSAPESHSQGTSVVTAAIGGTWLQYVDSYPEGSQDMGFLTCNPVTRLWVAVALDSTGNSVVVTGTAWTENRLVLSGNVTIVGEKVILRQTLTKISDAEYTVFNEEQLSDGEWRALDRYRYRRRRDN